MKYFHSFFLYSLVSVLFSAKVQAQDTVWKRHVIDNSLSGADGVRLADINKDGLEDIATGWEESGQTKVYLHPGFELVKEKWPSVIVGEAPAVEDAVFADLDKDGAVDVISSTEGDSRSIYIHWAPNDKNDLLDSSKWITEVLSKSKNAIQWMFALPLQIDRKHGLDIVAGAKGKESKLGWFQAPKNPRNMERWKWYPISTTRWVMSLITRDMDFDGDMDIIISDRKPSISNGVRWLENPGKLKNQKLEWKNHLMACNGLEVMFMDMADLDGDGLEDAIVTEYTNQQIVYIKRLDKSGLRWKRYNIDIPAITGRAKAVKIGDINGDGIPDLVHATNTLKEDQKEGIIWMSFEKDPMNPKWNWHHLSGTEGYKFDRIELLDIDGDGDLDVLTCEENYGLNSEGLGVIWYENPFQNTTTNE
jgi:hypothetical protein